MFLANSAPIARAVVEDTFAIRTTNRMRITTFAFVLPFFPHPGHGGFPHTAML
jgi:hypothetical protein